MDILRDILRQLSVVAALAALLSGCASPGAMPGAQSAGSTISAQIAGGADQTTLTYINLPTPYTFPWGFLNAPDGSLYFGEWGEYGKDGGIGRLNADGSITEVDLGPGDTTPIPGSFDASGNAWFSNCSGFLCSGYDAFGFLSPGGAVTQFAAPSNSRPRFNVIDPNGNAWFTMTSADAVARVSPSGTVTTFPLPKLQYHRAGPNDIIIGPDGALWITEYIGDAIVRMNLNGNVTNVYPLSTEAGPRYMAVGQDGNIWFSEIGSEVFGDPYTPSQIVKMTPSTGAMTFYAEPSALCESDVLRAANGGFVFADIGTNAVGFIDYNGNINEWPIAYDGGAFENAQFALQGSDGSFYFADDEYNRIGKITLGKKGMIFPQAFTISGANNTQLVGVGVLGDRGPYSASVDNTNVATVAPVSGFPMNFIVTGVGSGTATLTIKGKGKAMTAAITVTGVSNNARHTNGLRRITLP